MSLTLYKVMQIVLPLVCVMLSSVIHEVAHAYVALRCGDHTAQRAGRITLNPARHLDPFGSFVLPLMMAAAGGPIFAYARPVPFNPRNLRHPERDEALVALAGPASNLLQALAGGLLSAAVWRVWGASEPALWVLMFLSSYVAVNCTLAFFNLIPLPPLDGSKVVSLFVRGRARERYNQAQRYGMPILLIALYVLPSALGFDPLGALLNLTAGNLTAFLLSL